MTDDTKADLRLSRRQFVGTAAAGAVAIGALAGASSLSPHIATMPATGGVKVLNASGGANAASTVPLKAQGIPSTWDYSADVVVE